MRRFAVDTTVLMYADGRDHPYRAPCREIMARIAAGQLIAHASVEVIQEFAHVVGRRGASRQLAVRAAQNVAMTFELYGFEHTDLPLVFALFGDHPRLGMRDAVIAAGAMNRSIGAIITADRGFDGLPGLERIDPADTTAVASLA